MTHKSRRMRVEVEGNSSETSTNSRCEDSTHPLDVVQEYVLEGSIHGVRFVGRPESHLIERVCWAAAVVACAGCAAALVRSAYLDFSHSPLEVSVATTHFPLLKFPFPAVTICPGYRIRRPVAEAVLARFLNVTPDSNFSETVKNFLATMSVYQNPFYTHMSSYLSDYSTQLLEKLSDLNITDFMLQVLPKCEQMFESCFWRGRGFKCCSEFHLQRYEGGFCYSFNSLTSENRKHCPVGSGTRDDGLMSDDEERDPTCWLHRNAADGITTGLEVFLKASNAEDALLMGHRDQRGVRVSVHHPLQFPEASHDALVPERVSEQARVFLLRVAPYATVTDPDVRSLPVRLRRCFFTDERRLAIFQNYGLHACLIECRMRFIAERCGCHPYFFDVNDGKLPQCNATRLMCIANLGVQMRFFDTGNDEGADGELLDGDGEEEDEEEVVEDKQHEEYEDRATLLCPRCLPTCNEVLYTVESMFSDENNPETRKAAAYIDVSYKEQAAVKYKRGIVFGKVQLMVNFGGIVGLFLGISLLSGVELVYYALKLLRACVVYISRGCRRCKNKDKRAVNHHRPATPSLPHRDTPVAWSAMSVHRKIFGEKITHT